VSVPECILGLHATLRAANAHLERRARERAAELDTAPSDCSHASFVAKKQAL
jgi:hypothetical protein